MTVSVPQSRITRYIRTGHSCLGVMTPEGLTMTAGGHNDSLLWSCPPDADSGQLHSWSPGGSGLTAENLPGFSGERADPVTGNYPLGNGYRSYSPGLMRFTCPDSLSPFGAGGINPYAYCAGDPVNHTDPTGHLSWQAVAGIVAGTLGLVFSVITAGASVAAAGGVMAALEAASVSGLVTGALGVVSDVTGIVSGAEESAHPQASAALGWVSLATGLAGMAAGIAGTLMDRSPSITSEIYAKFHALIERRVMPLIS